MQAVFKDLENNISSTIKKLVVVPVNFKMIANMLQNSFRNNSTICTTS